MTVAAISTLVILLVLTVLMAVDLIRFRRRAKHHLTHASAFVLLFLVLYAGAYLAFPSVIVETVPLWMHTASCALLVLEALLSVTMGMYSCQELDLPDVPVVRALAGEKPLREGLFGRRHFFAVARVVVVASAYGLVLSAVTGMRLLGPFARLSWFLHGLGAESTMLPNVLVVALGVLAGEVIFRLGVQNYLARQFRLTEGRYWIAIVVASALWSLAGVDTEGPIWFVAALRFPVGLGLGNLARRYGLESSILAHGAFMTAYFALKPVLLGS